MREAKATWTTDGNTCNTALEANVFLALLTRESTEMVEKVMGDSWKDWPSFPFKHTAILSAVPSHTSIHRHSHTQSLALKNYRLSYDPALPLNSLSCGGGCVLKPSVFFSDCWCSRSTSKSNAFFSAALLRKLRFQKHKSGYSWNSLLASFCVIFLLPLVFSLSFVLPLPFPSVMEESSQITGDDGEGCNSNESGWTIYLTSPLSSDDVKENASEGSNVEDGSGYIYERRNGKEHKNSADDDDGDYDSLASDASTGPVQVKVLEGKEKGHGTNDSCSDEHVKDEQDETHTKLSPSCNKKAGKMKKGNEKTSRRGHNKRHSSSRTNFFW